jgi:hypothetical protein
MNINKPLFPSHAFVFKGGGGGGTPAIGAPPAPAASATSVEVTQAKIDAKRQAKARSGYNSTVLGSADEGSAKGSLAPAAGGNGKTALLGGG